MNLYVDDRQECLSRNIQNSSKNNCLFFLLFLLFCTQSFVVNSYKGLFIGAVVSLSFRLYVKWDETFLFVLRYAINIQLFKIKMFCYLLSGHCFIVPVIWKPSPDPWASPVLPSQVCRRTTVSTLSNITSHLEKCEGIESWWDMGRGRGDTC